MVQKYAYHSITILSFLVKVDEMDTRSTNCIFINCSYKIVDFNHPVIQWGEPAHYINRYAHSTSFGLVSMYLFSLSFKRTFVPQMEKIRYI